MTDQSPNRAGLILSNQLVYGCPILKSTRQPDKKFIHKMSEKSGTILQIWLKIWLKKAKRTNYPFQIIQENWGENIRIQSAQLRLEISEALQGQRLQREK